MTTAYQMGADAAALAAKLAKRTYARERAWMLRNASLGKLHTSEDYPRRLETLGLIERRGDRYALMLHDHVLTQTPLGAAVIEIWAREAAARLTAVALAALDTRLLDERIGAALSDEDRATLQREGAISWNGPPWRRIGRWERTSFGYCVHRVSKEGEVR
jgi:hypothetical protein